MASTPADTSMASPSLDASTQPSTPVSEENASASPDKPKEPEKKPGKGRGRYERPKKQSQEEMDEAERAKKFESLQYLLSQSSVRTDETPDSVPANGTISSCRISCLTI